MERQTNTILNVRIGILYLFHFVGLVGLNIPSVKDWFVLLIPFHLVLSSICLLMDSKNFSGINFGIFIACFLTAFVAEIIGVNTGLLFGNYQYSNILGFKIFHVPIVIGILWVALSFAVIQTLKNYFKGFWLPIFMGASILSVLDLFIEFFAIKVNLWQWKNNLIPVNNFITWFLLSIVILFIYSKSGFRFPKNKIGLHFLISISLFFVGFYLIQHL
jgi:bisanhydrobacterioruberin hydratase